MAAPKVEIRKAIRGTCISTTAYITFHTEDRRSFIRITDIIEDVVAKSGVMDGICFISPMHITSSVFINDDEPGLHQDFMEWLEKLAPYSKHGYRHNLTGEDNGDAHLKRTIMGRETVVAVTNGKLDLGPWEEIFYGEFDGMRPKRVLVKVIGIGEER
jgi:secondary thiamine-phosphate synthase enzyme